MTMSESLKQSAFEFISVKENNPASYKDWVHLDTEGIPTIGYGYALFTG